MAHVTTSRALKPDGVEEGRGGDKYGETEKTIFQPHPPAKRDQSLAYSVYFYYMYCWETVNGGNDVWNAAEMQRKWLCSGWYSNVQGVDYESTPCLHLSVIHIKVHFSNGLFTKWALAVFIPLSSLLCSKHLSLRQKRTLLLSLCLLQNVFRFHLHLFMYLSLLPPLIIHLCFSGDKLMDRETVTGTLVCDCEAWIQIGYILFQLSLLHFFQEGQVIVSR